MSVKPKLLKEGCKKGWSEASEPTVKQNGKTAPPTGRWRTRPTSATTTPTPSSAQEASTHILGPKILLAISVFCSSAV